MLLAADYPFLDVLWTILIIFLWISWFMLLFYVIGDVFRRRDASGWKKTIWLIVLLFLPFLGVFIYLITQNEGMTKRKLEDAQAAQAQMDAYVKSVAGGGAAAEIEKANQLLASGAISQSEYDAIKAKALAT